MNQIDNKYNTFFKILFWTGIILIIYNIYIIFNDFISTRNYENINVVCISENKKYIDSTLTYQRFYSYDVSGHTYFFNLFEVDKKPLDTVRYNPKDPNIIVTYSIVSFENVLLFFVGLVFIFLNKIVLFFKKNKKLLLKLKKNLMKINYLKFVDFVFWGYLCISIVYNIFDVLSLDNLSLVISGNSIYEIVIESVVYLFSTIIIGNSFFILIYLGLKYLLKRFRKDKLNANDFIKYEGYYRDVLKGFTPAEIAYIDNFEFDNKRIVVSTLLFLKLRKVIDLDYENNIIIVNNNNYVSLSNNEMYILNKINNGILKKVVFNEFRDLTIKDCVDKGILELSKMKIKHIIWFLAIILVIYISNFVLCITFFRDFFVNPTGIKDYKIALLVFSLLLCIFIPLLVLLFLSFYIKLHNVNNCVRTKKGEDLNKKIEGLKNFLKEFSNIDEKDVSSLVLWEEYLIYSIIFGLNDDISNDIYNRYVNV